MRQKSCFQFYRKFIFGGYSIKYYSMKYNTGVFLTLFFFFFSCKKEEKPPIDLTEIVIDMENPKELLFSQLVDTCFFIPLTSKVPIGEIWQLIIGEEFISVLDSRSSKSILIFNFKGELMHQLSEQGEGPGKYINPASFAISEAEEKIFVYSNGTKKIIEYKFGGEFLAEYSLNRFGPIDDFEILSNGFISSLDQGSIQEATKIAISDFTFALLKLPHSPLEDLQVSKTNIGKANYLYKELGNENFYYQEVVSPFFIYFNENEIKDVFKFSFSKNSLQAKYPEMKASEYLLVSRKEKLAYLSDNHVDNGSFMFLDLSEDGRGGLAIWDKKTNKAFKVSKLVNDLSLLMNFNSIPGTYNNTPGYLSLILPYAMFSEIRSKVDLSSNPYEGIIQSIKMEDSEGYVLLTYKVKEEVSF